MLDMAKVALGAAPGKNIIIMPLNYFEAPINLFNLFKVNPMCHIRIHYWQILGINW
jgi:hypothetical protein